MKAGLKKRMLAYLIDLIVIGLLLGIIMTFKEKDQKVINLRNDLNIVNELYASKEMEFLEYFDRYTMISQQLDQKCIIYTIFNILFIIIYFILIPFFKNGQTLGKKIAKIKVIGKEEKATIKSYFIRNLIINGLGMMILAIPFLYFLPNKMYFIFESILSFIQITLVILSISMILYRKDKRGLHDILSGTNVVLLS